jgi:hypothetical protein
MKRKTWLLLLASSLIPTLGRPQTVPFVFTHALPLPMLRSGDDASARSANNAIRYVGAMASRSGEDIGAQINSAYSSLPPTGGTIIVIADPGGRCYSFSTPIVANVAGKYLLLESGSLNSQIVRGTSAPACLDYTPTAGAAITLDYVPAGNSNAAATHGIQNLTLANNQCETMGGCGSNAIGITFGGANGGAQGATLAGLRVIGFGTGLLVQKNALLTAGGELAFRDCSISYNATGLQDTDGDTQHLSFNSSHLEANGTGASSMASMRVSNSWISSNTVVGVACSAPAACDFNDDHFENGRADSTHFIDGNGIFFVSGGDMRDDRTAGNTDWWMHFAGASFFVLGTALTTGGRTATHIIVNQTSGSALVQNNSSELLRDLYSNPQLVVRLVSANPIAITNGPSNPPQPGGLELVQSPGSPPSIPDNTSMISPAPQAFSGNNAFTGNNTFANMNNCVWVDASKYSLTDVGVSRAIAAANERTKCLRLSPTNATATYVFRHPVQWANADDIVLDLTGAVINMEANGCAFTLGETSTRHHHIQVFGGWIRKTSGGVYDPNVAAGNCGIEFRNISGGIWKYAQSWGFEKGAYLHAAGTNQGVSEVYIEPLKFDDNKFGVYMQPDMGNGNFVGGNHVLPGIITYDTPGPNYAGGYNVFIDDNGNAPGGTSAATGNVIDGTTLESSLGASVGTNRPEAPIWVNGTQNIFIKLYTEYASFKQSPVWVVDNSGAHSQRNQFIGSRGGNPILGLSSFRTHTPGSSNAFQTVTSERGTYIAGGDNDTNDPIMVLQEVDANTNTAVSVRDTYGTQRASILSDGNTAVSGIAVGGGMRLSTSNQSGTGSICMTTNCVLNTPVLTQATGSLHSVTGSLSSPTIITPAINGASAGTGIQGSDSKLLTSGTVSGVGSPLCLDANGGATTKGCSPSLVQVTRLGPSCVTGNNSYDSCANVLTWPKPFADAHYSVTCSGIGPSNPRANVTVRARSANSVTVNVVTYGSVGVSFSEIDCNGVHDGVSANTASVTLPSVALPPQAPVPPKAPFGPRRSASE